MIFGTAQFSIKRSAAHWRRLLRLAAELDVDGLDTAPMYGDGRSETMIGSVLKDRETTVTTKVGLTRRYRHRNLPRPIAGATSVGLRAVNVSDRVRVIDRPDEMRSQVLASLRRMQRSSVDCLLLHEVPPLAVTAPMIEVLDSLQRGGRTARLGVAGSRAEAGQLVDQFPGAFQVVQMPAADLRLMGANDFDPRIQIRVHGLVSWTGSDAMTSPHDLPVLALEKLVQEQDRLQRPLIPVVATRSAIRLAEWAVAWRRNVA